MAAIITLTSDFGSTGAYVAAMKGVILGINPQAKLIDICHSIQPQNAAEAAKEAKAHIYYCARCAVYVHEKCWQKHVATAHKEER